MATLFINDLKRKVALGFLYCHFLLSTNIYSTPKPIYIGNELIMLVYQSGSATHKHNIPS